MKLNNDVFVKTYVRFIKENNLYNIIDNEKQKKYVSITRYKKYTEKRNKDINYVIELPNIFMSFSVPSMEYLRLLYMYNINITNILIPMVIKNINPNNYNINNIIIEYKNKLEKLLTNLKPNQGTTTVKNILIKTINNNKCNNTIEDVNKNILKQIIII